MASVAEKGDCDWFNEGDDNAEVTYSCLTERVCCAQHKGEQNYVMLTPKAGYGPGAVANLVEQSGLRLLQMTALPSYLPKETEDEPTG